MITYKIVEKKTKKSVSLLFYVVSISGSVHNRLESRSHYDFFQVGGNKPTQILQINCFIKRLAIV